MRFWLSLILGTIVVSGGVTWLWLHQGAQLDSSYGSLQQPLANGQLEFDDVKMVANVIDVAPGDSHLNETKAITVPFRNTGPGPLKLQYLRASCKCVGGVSVDDVVLKQGGDPVIKNAGDKGTLKIWWTPSKDSCEECDKKRMLIAVELFANDPRPQFSNPFRFEILTRVADYEGKPKENKEGDKNGS